MIQPSRSPEWLFAALLTAFAAWPDAARAQQIEHTQQTQQAATQPTNGLPAQSQPQSTDGIVNEGELEAITVYASADASASGLSSPFAGGQVARGSRVGVLGTLDIMDTPFSTTSYTQQLMQDQQARSVADVLQNDPTVRIGRGFGNFQESYFIRGFITGSDDVAYNGLYGLLPRQYTGAEMAERVEILRGAGAFLYGVAPSGGGIGGTLNVLPKRAAPDPLNQFTMGFASGGTRYAAADVGRRFGQAQRTGLRLNVARRYGNTLLDHEKVDLSLGVIGLDWRGERVRLSADVGWQDNRRRAARPNVTINGLASVPSAPDNKINYAQPWTRSNEKTLFGTLRGEFDVNDDVTAWVAAGARQGKEFNSLAGVTVTNAKTGSATTYRFDNRRQDDVRTAETGLRARFLTGPVSHNVVASVSYFDHQSKNAYLMDLGNILATNIYAPVDRPRPAASSPMFSGGNMDKPGLTNRTRLTSFTLGDTIGLLDERLTVIAGIRHQRMWFSSYDYNTNREMGKPYRDSHNSPALGIVYRLSEAWSVYGNYIESLARGESAPSTASNPGEHLAPYVSKQREVGLKYDGEGVGASLALFSTSKPRGYMNPSTKVFSEAGQDRHRGMELAVFGEVTPGWRVLGGYTYLDVKQRDTGVAATDGKRVIGVPRQQANLGIEWDVPTAPGLTLDARAVATGSSYANALNTLRVPGWVRFDLGARYERQLPGNTLLTVRARIENVAGRDYWSSAGGYPGAGYLVLGAPRNFMVNASLTF